MWEFYPDFKRKKCLRCDKWFTPLTSGRQTYCGDRKDKKSCSYRHYVEYTVEFQKEWRKTEKGKECVKRSYHYVKKS